MPRISTRGGMSNRGFGFGYSAGGSSVPFGCATYGTAGTFTFTVPSGVTKISVVCVGAGGTGCFQAQSNSGGGGNLSYTNCIPVTAGEGLTVVVGNYSGACRASGQPSSVKRGATTLICAKGGIWGGLNPSAPSVGAVKYQGGNSAYCFPSYYCAGTGAAGYAGNGGRAAQAGSGGGGGGGGNNPTGGGGGGGGVGLVVQGPSGAGGGPGNYAPGGGGGSGGQPGYPGGNDGGSGGLYGGGGGNGDDCGPGAGNRGGVRIIYGGTGKSYPNNSAP